MIKQKNIHDDSDARELLSELNERLDEYGFPPLDHYALHRMLEERDDADPVCKLCIEIRSAAAEAAGMRPAHERTFSEKLADFGEGEGWKDEVKEASLKMTLPEDVVSTLRRKIAALDMTKLSPINHKLGTKFWNQLNASRGDYEDDVDL